MSHSGSGTKLNRIVKEAEYILDNERSRFIPVSGVADTLALPSPDVCPSPPSRVRVRRDAGRTTESRRCSPSRLRSTSFTRPRRRRSSTLLPPRSAPIGHPSCRSLASEDTAVARRRGLPPSKRDLGKLGNGKIMGAPEQGEPHGDGDTYAHVLRARSRTRRFVATRTREAHLCNLGLRTRRRGAAHTRHIKRENGGFVHAFRVQT